MKKIYTIASLDDLAHQFWRRADQINDQLHAGSPRGVGPRLTHSDLRALAAAREAWLEASAICAQTQLAQPTQTALVVRAPTQVREACEAALDFIQDYEDVVDGRVTASSDRTARPWWPSRSATLWKQMVFGHPAPRRPKGVSAPNQRRLRPSAQMKPDGS